MGAGRGERYVFCVACVCRCVCMCGGGVRKEGVFGGVVALCAG